MCSFIVPFLGPSIFSIALQSFSNCSSDRSFTLWFFETPEIAKNKDAQSFVQNKKAAKEGGEIAGNARKEKATKEEVKAVLGCS